jgi:Uri superfamily endonuclease
MDERRAQAFARPASSAKKSTTVPDSKGTYALLLRCTRPSRVAVGSLGNVNFAPGLYLYLGSAFGPGGLRARLARHAARHKVKRWHIDYIRPRMSLANAWFSTSALRLEHTWAAAALALAFAKGATPLARFGASDCKCPSHLVFFPDCDSSRHSIAQTLVVGTAETFSYVDAGALRVLARTRH